MNPRPHVGQEELCAVETGGCEFSVVGVAEVGEVRARAVSVEEGAVVVEVVVRVRVLVDSGSSPCERRVLLIVAYDLMEVEEVSDLVDFSQVPDSDSEVEV